MFDAFLSEEPEGIKLQQKATTSPRSEPDLEEPPQAFPEDINAGPSRPQDVPYAEKVREILEKFNVWKRHRIIDLPEENKMGVDLVNDWQQRKFRTRAYKLGVEGTPVKDHFDQRVPLTPQPQPPLMCRVVDGQVQNHQLMSRASKQVLSSPN
ncbi:hypothetical protein F4677DRAFT_440563 [Hypoxylon crocopeplum]|nr:hypothetical protein F4677DRAFT_440563 [Hypoxylon crocopeplum]